MVFKASRKINRILKTRVLLLLLVCLAMPAASKGDDIKFTSVTITSLNIRHCGHVLLATNAKNNEIRMSSKLRNSNKDSRALKKYDLKILKRVRTQLKVARNHFRNNREVIARLYSDVKTVMQTDYHYEWLPSQPLIWYKKHVRKLDKDAKVFILLPMLRDSLHNFSVTLEQMRQFSETHYMSNSTLRKLILDDLSKHLIAVLCEVETALLSMSLWHEEKIPPDWGTRTVIVGGPGWDPNPDHTAMMIQDWGVLTIYYRFLKEWLQISRNMVRDYTRDESPPWPVTTTAGSVAPQPSQQQQQQPPCIRHHRCGGSSKHKRHRKSTDFIT